MDDLDHKIIQLLAENARMPVKDIAQQVNLTSPAVSSRIHRRGAAPPGRPRPGRSADLGAGGRRDPRQLSGDDRAGIPGAAMLPRDRQLQLYHKGQLHRH